MSSLPPDRQFYDDSANVMLWRDMSRLFENFCGPLESKWLEKRQAFETVIKDVLARLDDGDG